MTCSVCNQFFVTMVMKKLFGLVKIYPYILLRFILVYIQPRTVEEKEHRYRRLTQLVQQYLLHSNTKGQKRKVE